MSRFITKLSVLLGSVMTFFPLAGYTAVYENIASLQNLRGPLEALQAGDAAEKGLILFDVDMTLTMSTNPILHMQSFIENKNYLKKLQKDIPPKMWTKMLNVAISEAPNHLIEETAPAFLHNLQNRGYHTLALTSLFTGPLEEEEPLEEKRYRELAALNINFSLCLPDLESLTLTDLPSHRGHFPRFYKGVLCANAADVTQSNKGEVLVSFLEKAPIKPTYILFVDDQEKELMKVEAALKKHFPDMRFKGVHFTGALSKVRLEKVTEDDFQRAMQAFKTKAEALP